MARTFISQVNQILESESYDDTLVAGSGLETQGSLQGDLNALRSQIRKLLWSGEEGHWYDAMSSRGVKAIDADLATAEDDINALEDRASTNEGIFTTFSGSMADRAASLEGRATTLEDRVTADEAAVAALSGSLADRATADGQR